MGKKLLVLGLVWLTIAGCASEQDSRYQKDGVSYGVTDGVFRGRWWSFYERGASFLNGAFYDEAIADFQVALKGRSRDSWRARTYGLHFVEYFPNRELGVALYHTGELEQAETYLQQSLNQIDTVRARYYLDLITRERIARGQIQDDEAPRIDTAFLEARIVSERELNFEAVLADDVGVAEVTINGEEVPQRGSETQVAVRKQVILEEGPQKIEIAAKDLADKEVVEEVEVVVDLTGPTIGIFSPIEPTVTPEGTVFLEGASVDKNGVSTVSVAQRIIAESAGTPRLDFDTQLPLSDGENTFVLAARDVAGNETRSAIKVFRGDPDSVEAKLWLQRQREDQDRIRLASASTHAAVEVLLSAVPESSGEIRMKSPLEDRPYRHNRTLRVSGEVLTKTRVASLTINGEPFTDLVGAPKESFNKRIPLDNDATVVRVSIRAEDEDGAVLERDVDVNVQPVVLNSPESKLPVAVLAFSGAGLSPETPELLRLTTEQQLLRQERFRILDRLNLEDVLTEQQLASALADPNQAIQLGKLTNSYLFLVGELFARDGQGLEIKVRVIDTATTDLVTILDAFVEDQNDIAQLERACNNIAAQLARLYPRLSGELVAVRGNQMVVNWTADDGVRSGAYMMVVHEEAPWIDDDTGEVLMPGEFIPVSRGRLEAVTDANSRAVTFQQDKEDMSLDAGMPAVTM